MLDMGGFGSSGIPVTTPANEFVGIYASPPLPGTIAASVNRPLFGVRRTNGTAVLVNQNGYTQFESDSGIEGVIAGFASAGVTYWTISGSYIRNNTQNTYLADNLLNLGGGVFYLTTASNVGQMKGFNGLDLMPGALGGSGPVRVQNANVAQEMQWFAGNGAYSSLKAFNESLTIAAAASTDSSTTIPAGAIIESISVRVTTVIPTATTFTVTAATGGNTFSTAAVSTAAGSTDIGTAAGFLQTAAGTKVRITPNSTPGAATGVVRICGYYRLPVAPTS